MKKFTKFEELIKYIGVNPIYAQNELSNYLGNIGSSIGSFTLEVDNKTYKIEVNSHENMENNFGYEYILLD